MAQNSIRFITSTLTMILVVITISGLTSCTAKKKSSTVAPHYNPNPYYNPVVINPNPYNDPFYDPNRNYWNSGTGNTWNFEYYFYDSHDACSTGRHVVQGYNRREVRNAICRELQNDQINNNCAEQQRRQLFRQYCSCRRGWNSNINLSFSANIQVKREAMPGQDQGQQMPAHKNYSHESRGNAIDQK